MADEREPNERFVECPEHGPQQPTYVCQHLYRSLRTGVPVGFVEAEIEPDDEDQSPMAWCEACETDRLREDGEWNDRSEANLGVTLLCGACYARARALNNQVRQ